jgi:PPOX class probable F420-dependent enzyme
MLPDPIADFVNSNRVARLGTVDDKGRPHVVPICFVYFDGCLYSVLDTKPKRVPVHELRRVRNLLSHPSVQVVVDRWDEDWARLAYVQLRGRGSLLEQGPEHDAALGKLKQRYAQYGPMELGGAPIVRVEVDGYVSWGAIEGDDKDV